MATRVVKTWRGNNRAELAKASRIISRLLNRGDKQRRGRGGEDYFLVTLGGVPLDASLISANQHLQAALLTRTTLGT